MNIIQKSFIKWPLLVICALLSTTLIGMITIEAFPAIVDAESPISWPDLILISLGELLVLDFLARKSHYGGWRLLGVLFAVYAGTKILMMMIEALFFLNIWQSVPMMSVEAILGATFHGLLLCGLMCLLIISWNKKWHSPPSTAFTFPPVKPVLIIAFAYVVCYLAAGAFIVMPLGGEAFEATYQTMSPPVWMPIFQFGRGVIWAMIVWLVVQAMPAQHRTPAVCFSLSVFGAAQLLHPNPFMSDHLRAAHIVEVVLSMSIFGWYAVKQFTQEERPHIEVNA
ncbi:hypothetical protein [Teredinibacter sp. KSP-S5-2]|uniref:hypothetical protein n=1 Tax=Teredinibacter sp. KSP-S5-2 TaxID=3034506 RepID=UPI002934DA73|nr:hypothetical protein [Teredinibacter sp. KSP-S5-2]WNO10221.1 hypothetical protein P5V12_03445 [Teredinibacter sp. KSP-S5-2]